MSSNVKEVDSSFNLNATALKYASTVFVIVSTTIIIYGLLSNESFNTSMQWSFFAGLFISGIAYFVGESYAENRASAKIADDWGLSGQANALNRAFQIVDTIPTKKLSESEKQEIIALSQILSGQDTIHAVGRIQTVRDYEEPNENQEKQRDQAGKSEAREQWEGGKEGIDLIADVLYVLAAINEEQKPTYEFTVRQYSPNLPIEIPEDLGFEYDNVRDPAQSIERHDVIECEISILWNREKSSIMFYPNDITIAHKNEEPVINSIRDMDARVEQRIADINQINSLSKKGSLTDDEAESQLEEIVTQLPNPEFEEDYSQVELVTMIDKYQEYNTISSSEYEELKEAILEPEAYFLTRLSEHRDMGEVDEASYQKAKKVLT